jgi:hypothetical protein
MAMVLNISAGATKSGRTRAPNEENSDASIQRRFTDQQRHHSDLKAGSSPDASRIAQVQSYSQGRRGHEYPHDTRPRER